MGGNIESLLCILTVWIIWWVYKLNTFSIFCFLIFFFCNFFQRETEEKRSFLSSSFLLSFPKFDIQGNTTKEDLKTAWQAHGCIHFRTPLFKSKPQRSHTAFIPHFQSPTFKSYISKLSHIHAIPTSIVAVQYWWPFKLSNVQTREYGPYVSLYLNTSGFDGGTV